MKMEFKTKTDHRRTQNRNAAVRTLVQLFFFIMMPGAFVAGFNGVKTIFQAIGTGQPLPWNGFTMALAALCVCTVLFGRYFCGYVCAFCTLGDAVYRLSGWIQTKLFRRKRQLRLPERFLPWGQKLKYLILAAIVILCAMNLYSALGLWSPWEVFSLFTALRTPPAGSALAIALLVLIVLGMALQERFFCQFLCPMGAVFSLLPIMPFGQLRRAAERCPDGCKLCKSRCPVSIRLDEDSLRKGECIACERCANGCPYGNLSRWDRKLFRQEIVPVLLKAAVFFVLGVLLGLSRFPVLG